MEVESENRKRPVADKPSEAMNGAMSGPKVRVLSLQGPPSPFARELGEALRSRGAVVKRINLCVGDWLYWHGKDTVSFRGGLDDWEDFLATFIQTHGITDIIYFADRFPYHRVAQKVARKLGVNAISYEYGYLRPDWIIVEPGGQSAYSHFTRDLEKIRQIARTTKAPDLSRKYSYDFSDESKGDVRYHLSNYLLWFFYPWFQRDRVYNPILEYASYNPRFARARLARSRANALVQRLCGGKAPYFIVPLQMQNDYQVRENSPYHDQRIFLDQLLESFAENAAENSLLVVKIHPLDNGLENWRRHLKRTARRLNLARRVSFLDGGDLDLLAKGARGMLTINSTSGMTALRNGCPLKVMGSAVFDIPGLTHQGKLDDFWTDAKSPDPADVRAFIAVLAAHCHVRGDFYGPEGRAAACAAFADRIIERTIWQSSFEIVAPRLEAARRMGIDVDE